MLLHSNTQNFKKDVLDSEKLVIVDFFAEWCGPCQVFAPVVEDLATSDNSLDVVKIDIDADRDLAIQYNIEAVPTLVVFKNGKELDKVTGILDKTGLNNFINQYKNREF